MDSDSGSETNSIVALDLDADSEPDVESSQQNDNDDQSSETSSTNEITDLLGDLESSSDEMNIETTAEDQDFEENDENDPNRNEINQDDDYNDSLSIDMDGLANNDRNPDEMFDKINCDPEWTQNFS